MNLKGKTILLTGATGGIGSVIASHLIHEKGKLILLGRNKAKLNSLRNILDQPKNHSIYSCDLSNPSSRSRVIKRILAKHHSIDILINNAGIGLYKPSKDFTPKEWHSSYELNVHTPFFLSQSLNPDLTVNIGSCSAVQFRKERALYNSTKAALRSLTLCQAQESPSSFVHITLDSTLTPFGPLTLKEKERRQSDGMEYLSPEWVTNQIVKIIKNNSRESEYVLSPHCHKNCGHWEKP